MFQVGDYVKLPHEGTNTLFRIGRMYDSGWAELYRAKDYSYFGTRHSAVMKWVPIQVPPTLENVPLPTFPTDAAERKTYPVYSGVLQYFPAALAAIAHHSFKGNEQHNPGQPLHWARGKSTDHLDAAVRHIMEDDLEAAAWRILAALQEKLEKQGHAVAPGATLPKETTDGEK
jgi:hypothetical protein